MGIVIALLLFHVPVSATHGERVASAEDATLAAHSELSTAERSEARAAFQRALETRTSNMGLSWGNVDGTGGTVTPTRTFRIESGEFCRDFREIVALADGTIETETGTACRRNDGYWHRIGP